MKVKIESNQHGTGKVFIDGQEQKHVKSVWLSLGAGEVTIINIEYLSKAVEFEGEAQVIAHINGKKYLLIEEED